MVCPYDDCRRPSAWLHARSRPGHCARCHRWLGDLEATIADEDLSADEIAAQTWIVEAVGELVEAAPSLDQRPQQQQVVQTIRSLADRLTGGNRRALSHGLGLPDMTVYEWICGRTRPSLWMLLELCHQLGTTPLRFITSGAAAGGVGGAADGVVDAWQDPGWTMERGRMIPRLPDQPKYIRTYIDPEDTRGVLEAILASGEVPPPSLREVCRRLGVSQVCLKTHLPELCQAISERFRSYQLQRGERTRQAARAKVREAVLELHAQGIYPSTYRIWLLRDRPSWIRNRFVLEEWHQTLRELGWET